MVEFIESKKIDYCLFASLIITICITFLASPFRLDPLHFTLLIYVLIYIIRIFLSFHNWKISKGISLINACLNFQIAYALVGIGFTFLGYWGYPLLVNNAIVLPQFYLLVIGVFLLFRYKSTNWKMYWTYLRFNIFKAVLGITICFILFYAFDMPEKLDQYQIPHESPINLPKKLF